MMELEGSGPAPTIGSYRPRALIEDGRLSGRAGGSRPWDPRPTGAPAPWQQQPSGFSNPNCGPPARGQQPTVQQLMSGRPQFQPVMSSQQQNDPRGAQGCPWTSFNPAIAQMSDMRAPTEVRYRPGANIPISQQSYRPVSQHPLAMGRGLGFPPPHTPEGLAPPYGVPYPYGGPSQPHLSHNRMPPPPGAGYHLRPPPPPPPPPSITEFHIPPPPPPHPADGHAPPPPPPPPADNRMPPVPPYDGQRTKKTRFY